MATPAEPVRGVDPNGRAVQLDWPVGQRSVLAFLTGSCTTCREFWEHLAAKGAYLGDEPAATVVVVTPDPSLESRRGVSRLASPGTTVVMSTEAWTAYGVRGAPWFVVVDDGVVTAEDHASSWHELVELATRLAPQSETRPTSG